MDFDHLKEERIWDWAEQKLWFWPKKDDGLWNIREELRHDQIPKIMTFVHDKLTCVQAGGALGMAPLIYSYLFETVYTFEPNPTNFYFLNLNCRRENVVKLNAILGEKHGLAGIGDDVEANNRGIFTVKHEGFTPTFTVDDLELKSCGLIHLDMEGYEEYALRGAVETMRKFSPVVVGEGINSREPCKKTLHDLGYRYVENVASDAIFVRD